MLLPLRLHWSSKVTCLHITSRGGKVGPSCGTGRGGKLEMLVSTVNVYPTGVLVVEQIDLKTILLM